jgi:succinyl-CoA synthetase beta subunit
MKLQEYQTKNIFAKHSIPIPRGRLAFSATEAKHIAQGLGGRVVIKAQVLIGGRGKAGGIRLAKSAEEAENLATKILGMEIRGLRVHKILVDECINIARENYLGIINDRSLQCPVILASGVGGGDIEDVARYSPEKIIKLPIDPLLGLQDFQIRDLANRIDIPKIYWHSFVSIGKALWQIFSENDATLVEINPLVITSEGGLMALDGKMVLDDNALFRHPELGQQQELDTEESSELEAKKFGLSYIKLDGQIGCMVNGAGLAMATMDIIQMNNGKPANFLDIGGGASAEKVATAFKIILSDPSVQVVLINIFGGITRCDEVAKGIIEVMQETNIPVPIVVRLAGTNDNEGFKLLKDAAVITAETLSEAAQKAIAYTRE